MERTLAIVKPDAVGRGRTGQILAQIEAAGLQIEFIRKLKAFRKEARIKEIVAERGDHPGLVHIFSAMESCPSYRGWHEKTTHRTFLKPTSGKCLHYYFIFHR